MKKKIFNNKYWLYRTLWWLFSRDYDSRDIIDFVINELKLTKDDIVDLITNYTYKEEVTKNKLKDDATHYDKKNIITQMIFDGNDISFKTFISIVGKQAFNKVVFICDEDNMTGLEASIRFNRIKILKYILSQQEIQEKIASSKYWLYRTLWWLFHGNYDSRRTIDLVISKLIEFIQRCYY